jgi:hypothetical protein
MADDLEHITEPALAAKVTTTKTTANPQQLEEKEEAEHYEVVAEYRIGEGPPPLPLLIIFGLIICWAMISWIPFFGY